MSALVWLTVLVGNPDHFLLPLRQDLHYFTKIMNCAEPSKMYRCMLFEFKWSVRDILRIDCNSSLMRCHTKVKLLC